MKDIAVVHYLSFCPNIWQNIKLAPESKQLSLKMPEQTGGEGVAVRGGEKDIQGRDRSAVEGRALAGPGNRNDY